MRRRYFTLFLKASQIAQGFIFSPTGGALVQMLLHLWHLGCNVLTRDLKLYETRHEIEAFGAGNLFVLSLIDVSQPPLKTVTVHDYSSIIRCKILPGSYIWTVNMASISPTSKPRACNLFFSLRRAS